MEYTDSDSDDGKVSILTWNKIQSACHSQGYREGLTEGKERKLQEGFDQGYSSGFQQTQHSAEIKGFLSAIMLKNKSDLQLTERLKTVIKEINQNSN